MRGKPAAAPTKKSAFHRSALAAAEAEYKAQLAQAYLHGETDAGAVRSGDDADYQSERTLAGADHARAGLVRSHARRHSAAERPDHDQDSDYLPAGAAGGSIAGSAAAQALSSGEAFMGGCYACPPLTPPQYVRTYDGNDLCQRHAEASRAQASVRDEEIENGFGLLPKAAPLPARPLPRTRRAREDDEESVASDRAPTGSASRPGLDLFAELAAGASASFGPGGVQISRSAAAPSAPGQDRQAQAFAIFGQQQQQQKRAEPKTEPTRAALAESASRAAHDPVARAQAPISGTFTVDSAGTFRLVPDQRGRPHVDLAGVIAPEKRSRLEDRARGDWRADRGRRLVEEEPDPEDQRYATGFFEIIRERFGSVEKWASERQWYASRMRFDAVRAAIILDAAIKEKMDVSSSMTVEMLVRYLCGLALVDCFGDWSLMEELQLGAVRSVPMTAAMEEALLRRVSRQSAVRDKFTKKRGTRAGRGTHDGAGPEQQQHQSQQGGQRGRGRGQRVYRPPYGHLLPPALPQMQMPPMPVPSFPQAPQYFQAPAFVPPFYQAPAPPPFYGQGWVQGRGQTAQQPQQAQFSPGAYHLYPPGTGRGAAGRGAGSR